MPSSFKNIFEALNTIPPGSIKSKRTFGVTGFYTIKFGLFIAYFSKIGTKRKICDRKRKVGENRTFSSAS